MSTSSHSISAKPQLEVCLSPALLPTTDVQGKIVVIVDIFRASSAICTALAQGVKAIIPVKDIEDALAYKAQGYIAAAERKGEVVEGFDFGNSPYAFMDEKLRGQTVVLTTSNCTAAIHEVSGADEILIGAFSNISTLSQYLLDKQKDVVLLCAGWKNRFSLEDSIFTGALAKALGEGFELACDAAIAMEQLYACEEHDLAGFLQKSSHRHRLGHLNIQADIDYCLLRDQANVVPRFDGQAITLAT